MDYTLVELEDAIIAKIATDVSYLKSDQIYTVPSSLALDAINNYTFKRKPNILLAWQGFNLDRSNRSMQSDKAYSWTEEYIWSIFVVTESLRSDQIKMRGGGDVKGAYEITTDIIASLQGELLQKGMMQFMEVPSCQMVMKTTSLAVYRIDVTTAQARTKTLTVG